MNEATQSILRPSMLPKLAQCGHYRSEEFAGEAAERGTLLDIAFRRIISRERGEPLEGFDPGDLDAVTWAVKTAQALAGDCELEARETELKVDVGIAGMTGTADLLCEKAHWSADLKTGQIRDYEAQQAAYALGFMEKFFANEWTVYLLFCDTEEVVAHRFTYEEATEIVHDALALYNGGVPPQSNDYCGWCAQRWSCPARREQLGLILSPGEAVTLDLIALDSAKLRDFALACKTVEDFGEQARALLLERSMTEKIPGVSRCNGRKTRSIPAVELESVAKKLLPLIGSVSEAKALEAWGDAENFPSDKVIENMGASYVRISRPKKKELTA